MLRQTEKYDLSVIGLEEVFGRPVITIRFEDKAAHQGLAGPEKHAQTYSFDAGQGHLPGRHAWLFSGKQDSVTYVTRARECSNQRWFPERIVIYFSNQKAPRMVREIRVLDLEVDSRPAPEDFMLTLPAGTMIKEGGTKNHFRLRQQERVNVDNLPKLWAMLQEKKTNPLMDTAIVRSSSYRWAYWAGGALAGILALGLLVYRRYRVT